MIQRRETGGAGKGEQSGCLGRPDDLPCHGEEMRLTQKYTEGLFLEILCLSIPQNLSATRVELASLRQM